MTRQLLLNLLVLLWMRGTLKIPSRIPRNPQKRAMCVGIFFRNSQRSISNQRIQATNLPKADDEKDEQPSSESSKEESAPTSPASKDDDKSNGLNEELDKSPEEKAAKPPTNMSEARQAAVSHQLCILFL